MGFVTVTMARDIDLAGIASVSINPGWIRTAMGGDDAPLELDEAGRDVAALLERLDASFAGRFVDRFGDDEPW